MVKEAYLLKTSSYRKYSVDYGWGINLLRNSTHVSCANNATIESTYPLDLPNSYKVSLGLVASYDSWTVRRTPKHQN